MAKILGGDQVRKFEKLVEPFRCKTRNFGQFMDVGLITAVGALDLEPGDEVIVPPFTMCATATAVLVWNAIPVFADIEADKFCICPVSVEENITERTKAIIVVDIFGQSADMNALINIAKKYNLKIINDAAQAINASWE